MALNEQKLVPLVLGLDPSMMRLGFAFTELMTGKPRWCGTLPIYLPDKGWREKQLSRALHGIRDTLTSKADAHYYIPLIVIEQMFVGLNPKTAIELADVAGWTGGICHMIWPDARFYRYSPAEWRKKCGLSGKAPKEEVYAHAVELGFTPPPRLKDPKKDTGQDAADAGLMSQAGWRAHVARSAAEPVAAAQGAD